MIGSEQMKNNDPLYPYKNLFITACPGAGATTLATNIISKYLDNGKRCLVFENPNCFFIDYIERTKAIRENIEIKTDFPYVKKHGNLVVTHRYYFELEFVLTAVEEFNADIIVFEEARTMKEDVKSLIQLTKELKKRGKLFIFVTHTSKNISRLWHKDPNIPLYSRYRKAIPYFDATVIIDRDVFNDNDIEKIRLFEKGERKYRSIPINFDFPKQKVTYK